MYMYLAYKGEVKEYEVLRELTTADGYLIEYNSVKTIIYTEELDTPLKTSIHPKRHSIFSFDKEKAISIYNEYMSSIANELLDNMIDYTPAD